MIFPAPIVDLLEPFGAYGGDPLAIGGSAFGERFPFQVQDLLVEAALDGPQVSVSWVSPAEPFARLRVLRKLQEYPRDETDGVLVLETHDPEVTQLIDVDNGLVGANLGDTRWWYYRVFTLPSELAVADQFGGLGQQTLVADPSELIDMQRFPHYRVRVQETSHGANQVLVQTAPTRDGPWTQVGILNLVADELQELQFSNVSHKYVRVDPTADCKVSFIANRDTLWQTSLAASQACLAYRSGYHLDVAWNHFHLPQVWRELDDRGNRIDKFLLSEGRTVSAHRVNQREPANQLRGPLYRFLKILCLELDRVKAHVDALREFSMDIDHAPEHVLQHIAYTLGWSVDLARPLLEVRDELLRQTLVWKHKGSVRLLVTVAAQILGVVPRVQEGGGIVQRVFNPDLLHTQQHDPQFIGGVLE